MKSQEKIKTFEQFDLRTEIMDDIREMGFKSPTPVQEQCIPPAMKGRDVIGLAQTGTGKTAAFGLPLIEKVTGRMEMTALILAPTRELARQIAEALEALGKSSDLRVAVVVGGVPIKEDYKAFAAWPNVVVATPGRLIDHLMSQTVVLSDIEIAVVDEADRMYDMGFMPQITTIMDALPQKRQTLMFTATMPDEVEKLARRNMSDPIRIQIGQTAPPHQAEQSLFNIMEEEKTSLLLDLLGTTKGRVLVFARTKRKVEKLARALSRRHRVTRIHGDRTQPQRDEAMAKFRDGRCRILIATDIAARGLDIADIEHVINYDFPGCAEDYIHRIGRTARAAAKGMATSFVTHSDKSCLKDVQKLTPVKAQSHDKYPVTKTPTSVKRKKSRRGGRNRSKSGAGSRS